MYAPDVVQGNDGKYYLYYCLAGQAGKNGFDGPISVAVCDTPAGKYEYLGDVRYPDGRPMTRFIPFDPAVINDNGTIRLYYGWSLPMTPGNGWLGRKITEKLMVNMFHKSPEEIRREPQGIMGANTVELEDDMLTVKDEPRHIIPYRVKGTDFEEHPFYEASSIRKINGKYYFIYSSQQNHELCYAVSDCPDRAFKFGGTIVSNGDVGINGRSEKDRLNMTGTTHGSIENINGDWYVFYHRLTHKSDYSRQACAEKIALLPDGSIRQVEITSCGLNGGPLKAKGEYPAAIACNITSGNMPHGANRIYDFSFPNVNHEGDEVFVAEIADGTMIGYKYFDFDRVTSISLCCKGEADGRFEIFAGERRLGTADITANSEWATVTCSFDELSGAYSLYLYYRGEGTLSLLKIAFE